MGKRHSFSHQWGGKTSAIITERDGGYGKISDRWDWFFEITSREQKQTWGEKKKQKG